MSKNSNKKQNGRGWMLLLIAAVAVGITVLVVSVLAPEEPVSRPPETTQQPPAVQTTAPAEETGPAPTVQVEMQGFSPINLGSGLTITDVGSYNGTYMEDGSDEFVSGVMMIVVTNDGDDDIQLADIELSWDNAVYSFRLTNLAASARIVLLEQERSACPDGAPQSAIAKNVAVFSEPMDLCEDRIAISGMDGMLNVRNISGADIDGDIYVYYKYAAEDLFYGGITFRVRVEGGLAAGELRQLPAGHYSPAGCTIVHVECHG